MKTLLHSLKGLILLSLFCLGNIAFANNIKVSNISLEDMNASQNYVMVEFDVSWENSWRISAGPANWDAAWIIIKYRKNGGAWGHALLSTTGFVNPSGGTVKVSPDNRGAMLYRSEDGSGNVDYQNMRLRWDYGTNVDISDMIDVQVFAMEMVYVPEGAFYVGSDGGESTEWNRFHVGGNEGLPYQINSENQITISNTAGNLYYMANNFAPGDQLGPIPAEFPKGFKAFYCLKYEVSQAQWVNFFNTLTLTQKLQNDITSNEDGGKGTDNVSFRNGVSWGGWIYYDQDATTTHPDLPITYVSIGKMNAFLYWAALRPMTELEFVKACRGPIYPVKGEFAWGTRRYANDDYTYSGLDTPSEKIDNLPVNMGNAVHNGTESYIARGPRRNGIFAASATNHTREETGATYYGIMEMSGNVQERAVTVGNPTGRFFTGIHGNGELSEGGFGDEWSWNSWPDRVTNKGYSFLGGSYSDSEVSMKVADRYRSVREFHGSADHIGVRGVRTDY